MLGQAAFVEHWPLRTIASTVLGSNGTHFL